MKTCIRVCEIWVPSKYRTELEFHSGLYGALQRFRERQLNSMCFGYDEGLPGKASGRRAIRSCSRILQHSLFQARRVGAPGGADLRHRRFRYSPAHYLLAVVVLYCGDDDANFGCHRTSGIAAAGADLTLVDGYYGAAAEFEAVSREAAFKPGAGLPGKVWQSGMPEVMSELWYDQRFKRRDAGQLLGPLQGPRRCRCSIRTGAM